MKTCGFCKEEKSESEFYKKSASKDGLQSRCKECIKDYFLGRPDHPVSVISKICRVCNLSKPAASFRADPKVKDGLFSYCKLCTFFGNKLSRYNLTVEQWDEMMLNQGGMCAICDRETTLVVDHDHKTGKVRQLLCNPCNWGIGILQDSAEILTKAAEYVKKHSAT